MYRNPHFCRVCKFLNYLDWPTGSASGLKPLHRIETPSKACGKLLMVCQPACAVDHLKKITEKHETHVPLELLLAKLMHGMYTAHGQRRTPSGAECKCE